MIFVILLLTTCAIALLPEPINAGGWDHAAMKREHQANKLQHQRNMENLRKNLEKQKIQRKKQHQEWARKHKYNMLKLKLTLRGPEDCKRIKNFDNKKMYPKTNNWGFTSSTYNGYPVRGETKHKTYKCTDPPRYKSKFYKVVSITYGVVNGKRLSKNNMPSTNTNYYYDSKGSKQFDWEPDMKKYRRQQISSDSDD